jgi:pyridinium-3,5-biscarboxylic acid mononucleotide synthase
MTRPGSDIRLDIDRLRRTGDPEVVLALHKTPEQTVSSLRGLSRSHQDRAVLATRCDEGTRAECQGAFPDAWIDDVAGTVVIGPLPPPRAPPADRTSPR